MVAVVWCVWCGRWRRLVLEALLLPSSLSSSSHAGLACGLACSFKRTFVIKPHHAAHRKKEKDFIPAAKRPAAENGTKAAQLEDEEEDEKATAAKALPASSKAPVLAVLHGWLRHAALAPARALLAHCLVEPGELLPPRLPGPLSAANGTVRVEWVGSGIVLCRGLPIPIVNAALDASNAHATMVADLQKIIAPMLDGPGHQDNTTMPQNVRLFAGHGGPELTWPDLAWFPERRASPPHKSTTALQSLRKAGAVLVATRGDFGTKMVGARATSLCECEPAGCFAGPATVGLARGCNLVVVRDDQCRARS